MITHASKVLLLAAIFAMAGTASADSRATNDASSGVATLYLQVTQTGARLSNQPASKVTISYISYIGKVIGIPGEISVDIYTAYYATSNDPLRPKKSFVGDLNHPQIYPGSSGVPLLAGLEDDWILTLADLNATGYFIDTLAPGTVGTGPNGFNAFEAAAAYEYQGKTYYFPAGTPCIFDNTDAIVQIFQTMAWAGKQELDDDPETDNFVPLVKAVDYTYQTPPNVDPCNH